MSSPHRIQTWTHTLITFVVLTTISHAQAASYGRRTAEHASHVARIRLSLMAGTTYTISTENLTAGGDTVMYLWQDGGSQVAWNDDYSGGGLASRIVYTPSVSGVYRLIIRSYTYASRGTCDVRINGAINTSSVMFAGDTISYSAHILAADHVQTALAPGGVGDTMLFGFDGSGNLRVFDDDDGVGFASKIAAPVVLTKVTVGTFYTWEDGPASVIVNDVAQPNSDADGDGLGTLLEAALCTCDTLTGTPCGYPCNTGVTNPQDSDGDGLRDDYEVFGRDAVGTVPPDFPQHLPRWGANPLRKDVFVEIDRRQAIAQLETDNAAEMIAFFDHPGSAGSVQNRDGSPGIKLHLDIGRTPPSSVDTRYGDWGGHGIWNGTFDDPSEQAFVLSRRGLFRYHVATTDNGVGYLSGNYAIYTATLASTGAHELAHNLSLQHGGFNAINTKPNYPSLMNYSATGTGFSLGTKAQLDPRALSEADGIPGVASCSSLGYLSAYNFTMQDQGGKCAIDWDRDGVIESGTVKADPTILVHRDGNPERGRYYRQLTNPVFFNSAPDMASPSMARANAKLYIGYRPSLGGIRLAYTDARYFDKTDCPGTPTELDGCATWSSLFLPGNPTPGTGPVLAPTYSALLVVWVENGLLKYHLVNTFGTILLSGTVPNVTDVIFEPSFARDANDNPMLVYRTGDPNQDGPLRFITFDNYARTWSAPTTKWDTALSKPFSGRAVVAAAAAPSSTGQPRAFIISSYDVQICVIGGQCVSQGYALKWHEIVGGNAVLLDQTNLQADATATSSYTAWPVTKRGGLAFMPDAPGGTVGRFHFSYLPSTQYNEPRYQITKGDGSIRPLQFLPASRFDNRWHDTEAGVALLGWNAYIVGGIHEHEKNLRWAGIDFLKMDASDPGRWVVDFRPIADGIVDTPLKDNDDFAQMRDNMCMALHGCSASICRVPGDTSQCSSIDTVITCALD